MYYIFVHLTKIFASPHKKLIHRQSLMSNDCSVRVFCQCSIKVIAEVL